MTCYLYIDSQGKTHAIYPPDAEISAGAGSKRCTRNAVLLSRLDCDVKVVELPSVRRDVRALLELKIAGLYPGSPEETVFDYRIAGKDRAILFIAKRGVLEECQSMLPGVSFFLPYSLVRRWLKRNGVQSAVCTFWWLDWHEILLFDRGEMIATRVFERKESPRRLVDDLRDMLSGEFRQASHFVFCSTQDYGSVMDALSSIRPLPERVLTAEEVIRRNIRKGDFLFASGASFVRRQGSTLAAVVLLLAAVLSSVFIDRRIQVIDDVRAKLEDGVERVARVKGLLEELESLEKELQELQKHRPIDMYRFLREVSEAFGEEPHVQQLALDQAQRFQIEASSDEPFSLMAKLEARPQFSSLKLSRVMQDAKSGKERFSLSGAYSDR